MMRTSSTMIHTKADAPVALFLFAHQDDEFGVFAQIEQEVREGRRVRCVYVTDGAATSSPDMRDAESTMVLQQLGVPADDIMFIGPQLHIRDCQLHQNVGAFAEWLDEFINEHPTLERCFVPAWEGGHPDHDLIHAITISALKNQSRDIRVLQYSLYNSRNCPGQLFRVLSPLPENGLLIELPIAWRDRFRYVRLCLAYPSQWRTWLGLFPFAFAHYVLSGVQQLQHVDHARIFEPPHARPLYYERRGFLDWPTLRSAIELVTAQKSVPHPIE